MGIIAFIILGALAGGIAKALIPGDDPGGFIITTIIGVVGALLGGFLAAAIFGGDPLDEFFRHQHVADGDRWLDRPPPDLPGRRGSKQLPTRLATEKHHGEPGFPMGGAVRYSASKASGSWPREGSTATPASRPPDVGEDAQRGGSHLVDVQATRLAAAIGARLTETRRD